MNNDDQNELLDILQDNNINAVIQPTKDGPVLKIFLSYSLKKYDHKTLADKVLSMITSF